jgi:predicted RNA-binding Zn-ribbon protein involved in translation (DUF1610 family)
MFRRRRQRRQFRKLTNDEIERVAPIVETAVAAVEADVEATATMLSELPGAKAPCPRCGTRMRMRRVKQGRKWWTLWVCGGCGETVRPADLPAHHRFAGWRA